MRLTFAAPLSLALPLAVALATPLACSSSTTTTNAGSDSDSEASTGGETTATTSTSSSSDGTSSSATSVGPDPSSSSTTTPMTSTTTGPPPTTTSTTGPGTTGTTAEATTGVMTTGTGTTGEMWPDECLSGDKFDGEGDDIMEFYGAPCMEDTDCVPLIGPDAICIHDILGVYEAPGGFCTRPCEHPDPQALETIMFPGCFGGGSASCIGANGIFTACLFPCESTSECHREGYVCRTVPLVDSELKYCLMPDACCFEEGCPLPDP